MAVSFGGLIGFVGLIVPHIVRFFVGHDARVLIPASAITGAFFVMAADLLGRVFFSPYELPVGIILSLLGAPSFLYLLMKKGARRVNA
jgi:iron complex transport system permease protein